MRRFGLIAVGVAVAALLAAAAPAGAHALAQSSDPPAGSTLKQAPSAVTVTFGETPDPRLSVLRVLDTSGQDHTVGKTQAVSGNARILRVALGTLVDGVYTVSWRTVSEVDGHLAAGTFSFGVGVTPTGAVTAGFSSRAPSPSPLSVSSRWLLYAGLMVLVGGAFVALACYTTVPVRLEVMLAGAAGVGLVGAAGITVDACERAHLAWSRLLGSSLGNQLAWRAVPISIAIVAAVAALRVPSGRPGRILVGIAGIAGLVAMWGDVEASHAAAAHTLRLVRMGDQWAHFTAAGVWAGGLAVLLATIGTIPSEDRWRAAKRFSAAALVGVAVIAATGFQRAYDEVGTRHGLVHAAFGQYVLVKVALLAALVGLGAVNRYRAVPAAAGSTRLLRRVGSVELIALGGVLAATGILQGLAPPTSVAAAPAGHPLVLTGHDFGTTVRVTLTISPGLAGFNEFTLDAVDFDTAKPVDASASLRFTLPARPDLGSSTLSLAQTRPGVFAARGANLSIDGTWAVDVALQRAGGGTEIRFSVTPRRPPQKIVIAPQGSGLPTLYTLELSGNRSVQTYLDPGHPGFNEFHVTFLGADGNEMPTSGVAAGATPPGAATPTVLTVRRLDAVGHFVADLPGAITGVYRFDVTGTTQTGDTIQGTFTIPVR
ncbi:MAG: copper resistance CopC/CopD family protein [Acidimicrobiales bacterium]